ncbi:MAG: helix-turn-helix transcriptional regulator [Clostridiaceae bacterium]|nr:helix-turn-helix transcriptional regulator [Clostridiaceae bacterium]
MEKKLEYTRVPDFRISYSETRINKATSIHHHHDTYEIVLFINADLQIFIKDYEYKINNWNLFFINEYDIHYIMYNATPNYIRYVIHFKRDYILPALKALNMEGILSQLASAAYKKTHLNLKDRTEILALFEAIHKATGYGHEPYDETSKARVLSNLVLLLIKLRELLQPEKPSELLTKNDIFVQKVIRYIDENFAKPITLAELSNSLYANKYYLCHLFKRKTGLTVMDYVQHRRVIEAQKLLKDTDKDIISIYYECGFNNVQHFYRVFKKISKITPYQYRKLHRED